ncbi:MAG: hypothetical protein QNJ31_07305 [Candidatus Caenarcaniphilales bacterium]|nr:hypothetical protein [Candidatus Caenarcaniphilales bacterium]
MRVLTNKPWKRRLTASIGIGVSTLGGFGTLVSSALIGHGLFADRPNIRLRVKQTEISKAGKAKHIICSQNIPTHPDKFEELFQTVYPSYSIDRNRVLFQGVKTNSSLQIKPQDFLAGNNNVVGQLRKLPKNQQVLQQWNIKNGEEYIPFQKGNEINVEQYHLPLSKRGKDGALLFRTKPNITKNRVVAVLGAGASAGIENGIPPLETLLSESFKKNIPIDIIIVSLPGHSHFGGQNFPGLTSVNFQNKEIGNCALFDSPSNSQDYEEKYNKVIKNLEEFLLNNYTDKTRYLIQGISTPVPFLHKLAQTISNKREESKVAFIGNSPFLGRLGGFVSLLSWNQSVLETFHGIGSNINGLRALAVTGKFVPHTGTKPLSLSNNLYAINGDGKPIDLSYNPYDTSRFREKFAQRANEKNEVPQIAVLRDLFLSNSPESPGYYWEWQRSMRNHSSKVLSNNKDNKNMQKTIVVSTGDTIIDSQYTTKEFKSKVPEATMIENSTSEHNPVFGTQKEYTDSYKDPLKKALEYLDQSN